MYGAVFTLSLQICGTHSENCNKLSRGTANAMRGNAALSRKNILQTTDPEPRIVCIALCRAHRILVCVIHCNSQSFLGQSVDIGRHTEWIIIANNEVPFFSLFRFLFYSAIEWRSFKNDSPGWKIRLFGFEMRFAFVALLWLCHGSKHQQHGVPSTCENVLGKIVFSRSTELVYAYNNWMRSIAISYFTVIWSLAQRDSIAANLLFKWHSVSELFIYGRLNLSVRWTGACAQLLFFSPVPTASLLLIVSSIVDFN